MDKYCYTEMDIYWFQGGNREEKVKLLFDRLTPLWQRRPEAEKCLVFCIGWLYDSVLSFNGDLDAVIPCCQPPIYEPWTYRQVAELVSQLEAEALKRDMAHFRAGLLILGGPSMDHVVTKTRSCTGWSGRTEQLKEEARYNIKGLWFRAHPEVDYRRFGGVVDYTCKVKLPEDEKISKASTFGEYFADKMVAFSQATGLKAVIMRDAIFSPAYIRGQKKLYFSPEECRIHTQSFIDSFGKIKESLPDFRIIGYNSGSSSMAEWRAFGFDLETLAMSGNLDGWITQTWASAWQDYWPAHAMGYTFQLMDLMANMAMLSKTPCDHLFLIETFDAWEPWDSVHQYPSKVAWEIWAYSHAAVLLGDGKKKRCDGAYLSWMNRGGGDLIDQECVDFLAKELKSASDDLIENDPAPKGYTLVYDRKSLENAINRASAYPCGECMDDWAGMLSKFGLPIMSIARAEDVEKVDADGWLYFVPECMEEEKAQFFMDEMKKGKPVLFAGKAAHMAPALKEKLGLACCETPLETLPSAAVVAKDYRELCGAAGLMVNQPIRTLEENEAFETVVSCLGGPIFAKHKKLPCFIWETPFWATPNMLHLTEKSVGSLPYYMLIGECLKNALKEGTPTFRMVNSVMPIFMGLFENRDGSGTALLGNLETGFTGNSQFAVHGILENAEPEAITENEAHPLGSLDKAEKGANIGLHAHKMAVIRLAENEK